MRPPPSSPTTHTCRPAHDSRPPTEGLVTAIITEHNLRHVTPSHFKPLRPEARDSRPRPRPSPAKEAGPRPSLSLFRRGGEHRRRQHYPALSHPARPARPRALAGTSKCQSVPRPPPPLPTSPSLDTSTAVTSPAAAPAGHTPCNKNCPQTPQTVTNQRLRPPPLPPMAWGYARPQCCGEATPTAAHGLGVREAPVLRRGHPHCRPWLGGTRGPSAAARHPHCRLNCPRPAAASYPRHPTASAPAPSLAAVIPL